MTTWIAIAAVGLVSYAFRALPLVVLDRVRISPRIDRVLRHAGAAALTALLVGALGHGGTGAAGVGAALATAVGLIVAVRGAPMLRVALTGGGVYAAVVLVSALAS